MSDLTQRWHAYHRRRRRRARLAFAAGVTLGALLVRRARG